MSISVLCGSGGNILSLSVSKRERTQISSRRMSRLRVSCALQKRRGAPIAIAH